MTPLQKKLTSTAVALSACFVAMSVAQAFDHRLLDGVNLWVKPAKFALSLAVLAATQAIYLHFTRPERQSLWHMAFVRWGLIVPAIFELGYISFQAALGQPSHFFVSDAFHGLMYTLMGVAAVIILFTLLPVAYEIARHPVAGTRSDLRFALVAAPILTVVLVMATAGYMSMQQGHAVGTEGGHFPLFGWNRIGGDLRVSHFFSLHIHQALPLLALLVSGLPRALCWGAVVAGTVAYAALCLWTFTEALAGLPFLPGLFS
ncbi:putative membrane protein [Asticcacaulis biprosthecium C19]|uniref:Putative membrane protein n=1 Tax=Asticcacaulis biprosthecium C19 TaxID=715226 RepID=F4QSK6_9CAUL|nr:hypothetical protein [Asticcacaulis biprosthecium]EGF89726.1 putative membrane protein [Asticcacaulis biprosthecium C19]